MAVLDHNQEFVQISVSAIAELAIEHWRLAQSLAGLPGGGPAPARHAARRIGDHLAKLRVETCGLDGRPYDPGMAARVIDAVEDLTLAPGEVCVMETLSPQVLIDGRVVRAAEVVTRSGPKGK